MKSKNPEFPQGSCLLAMKNQQITAYVIGQAAPRALVIPELY